MSDIPAEAVDLLGNQSELVAWIEGQQDELQERYVAQSFQILLEQAAQPKSKSKSMSGGACVKLCRLVEVASQAKSRQVASWAFSSDVATQLFTFYVEWNEYDFHRSMILVLDLLAQLLKKNPDQAEAASTKKGLLDNVMSIIVGRSTKPAVKSAIKTLEHFLTKSVFTLDDIKSCYLAQQDQHARDEVHVWERFMTDLFRYMRTPYVSATAGKLIVSLYRSLQGSDSNELGLEAWHTWLLERAAEDHDLIEVVKNHIFIPLFKTDRSEALRFLQRMNQSGSTPQQNSLDLDSSALLQLAALETGKRVGLVEEPDLGETHPDQQAATIVLHEKVLESVLIHPSHEVRSLAFSLLVTSPSTTRPYSLAAFDLLRKHLGSFFSDADAKFRMEVVAKARDMFKRLRGSICVLKRSIPRARAKARKEGQSPGTTSSNASGPILYQSNLVLLPEAQLVQSLKHHENFLKWFVTFLRDELIPTASYQRHIASLKVLLFVLRMESEPSKERETVDDQELFYDLIDHAWLRALFDLVMDPFDDVRGASASVLKYIFRDDRFRKARLFTSENDRSPAKELRALLLRAEELARRTSRADHSDGAARINQLLYMFLPEGEPRLLHLSGLVSELERKATAAEADLGSAVLEDPLHSSFASLCYVWQVVATLRYTEQEKTAVQDIQLRLFRCCQRAWDAVRLILCDDSPEGHLPQELEEVDGLDTKDLLSYSFRAVHESSNLMKAMVMAINNRSRENYVVPSQTVFRGIGDLAFDQLANLRHRGAFSTVSSTFASCCQLCKHLDEDSSSESPLLVWYKGTMDTILTQASTTRRSAGIPSMMTGILCANAAQPSFESVMERLMEIASTEARIAETDGSKLPQVHAYNCLKDIFKNSLLASLGNKSEQYLPQCLELAASGLRSEVWAIRNCGLIFFRSLIDSLFGTHQSKAMVEAGWDGKAVRIPFHRYPNLPNVLLTLLKTGHQGTASLSTTSSTAESVLPALDMIRRAGPPDTLRDELQVTIVKYLASPVWHVREIAARTLCSCLLHERWLETIKEIFQNALSASDGLRQNHVHGVLLALKFVLERLFEVAVDLVNDHLIDLTRFISECDMEGRFSYCPEIVTAHLEVVNTIWTFQRSQSSSLTKFTVGDSAKSTSALLKIQKTLNGMFLATESDDPIQQLRQLLLREGLGGDTLTTALESIPKFWNRSSTPHHILSGLCGVYIDICLKTGFVEAQVVALHNLADLLDHFLQQNIFDSVSPSTLMELWTALPLRSINPALSNAIVRSSGCILAILQQSNRVTGSGIHNWGVMMAHAGHDDNTFDTRFAAAESLRSFFAVVKADCTSEDYLPVLLALYDALNDDDDEVRDMASFAACSLLGQALVSAEAASRLQLWMTPKFGNTSIFKSAVVSRIVGESDLSALSWESAGDQLNRVLTFDDSLFAIEDNNLFIDEVRETKRWVAVFRSTTWTSQDIALQKLIEWVTNGLASVTRLAEQEDGPLGWASNPRVFAICARLSHAAVALREEHGGPEMRQALETSRAVLLASPNERSGLLVQPFFESEERLVG